MFAVIYGIAIISLHCNVKIIQHTLAVIVTLLANELVKEHDVTIMVYQDRFKEDRNMYHMSEDIKVDFIDNNEFVNRHHTPAFCWRYLVQKLNAKYGIFNKEKYNDILADAIFPKKTREKWVKY